MYCQISSIRWGVHAVQDTAQEHSEWLGREVVNFCNVTYPWLQQKICSVAKEAIVHLFWLLPYIAWKCGHYSDAATSFTVACASGLEAFLDDSESSATLALFVSGPIAVNAAIRAMDLISSPSAFSAISLLFQSLSLLKLYLMANGENK